MSEENVNQDIHDMLVKLGKYERDICGNAHRFQAFMKAAKAVKSHDKRLKSGAEAQKLSGIGPKISKKIHDFLVDGDDSPLPPSGSSETPKEEKVKKDQSEKKTSKKRKQQQEEPEPIKGKVPKTKNKGEISKSEIKIEESKKTDGNLISEHYDKLYKMNMIDVKNLELQGIRTIGDLRKQKSKYLLKNEAQILCLDNFDDLCEKISRGEVKKFESQLERSIEKLSPSNIDVKIVICGQYRRNLPELDTIDVLMVDSNIKSISHNQPSANRKLFKKNMKLIAKSLVSNGIIDKIICMEENRLIGLAKIHKSSLYRRININFVPKDQYVCSLFELTGPEQFCEKIRSHALENGYLLTPEYLRKIGYTLVAGLPIKLSNEEELFEYIDLAYVKPEDRDRR